MKKYLKKSLILISSSILALGFSSAIVPAITSCSSSKPKDDSNNTDDNESIVPIPPTPIPPIPNEPTLNPTTKIDSANLIFNNNQVLASDFIKNQDGLKTFVFNNLNKLFNNAPKEATIDTITVSGGQANDKIGTITNITISLKTYVNSDKQLVQNSNNPLTNVFAINGFKVVEVKPDDQTLVPTTKIDKVVLNFNNQQILASDFINNQNSLKEFAFNNLSKLFNNIPKEATIDTITISGGLADNTIGSINNITINLKTYVNSDKQLVQNSNNPLTNVFAINGFKVVEVKPDLPPPTPNSKIFVSQTDINDIYKMRITKEMNNVDIINFLKQKIKDNKKLFFRDPATITNKMIDDASITNIIKNEANSSLQFNITINDENKTFVINNITYAKSTYVPQPSETDLFVKNNEIDCIDVPPVSERQADNIYWIKGLIAENKGWFFSNPDIPNAVVTNSVINVRSSSYEDMTYNFDIKATYQSKTYQKSFTLINLNICKEVANNGKLDIINNPKGYSTSTPTNTKETAIKKTDEITYPTANFLELDVWNKSDTINKYTIELNTNASEVFMLDGTGYCTPNALSWSIAPEDKDSGFKLDGNYLSNTIPLEKDKKQTVRLISTISEANKQTKYVNVNVNFHLALAQPVQPEQPTTKPNEQATNAPTRLLNTWAECLNHAHVNKGVKVEINKFAIEACNEYVQQQSLTFALNEKVNEVFDLSGTNFTSNAKIEWNLKDKETSLFDIKRVKTGELEFRNYAPIIGPDGVSTIITATITESNKATKVVDLLVTFRGNGPCEYRTVIDYGEIAIATENIDFFVLPGTNSDDYNNRITLPTTTNKGVIQKYGNAPLPWKEDKDLTDQDLTNMFNYLGINNKWNIDLTFGQRKISSNRLANVYFEWLRTSWWRYFPYYSFANPNRIFSVKTPDGIPVMMKIPNTDEWTNEKTWYVDSVQKGTYADEWLKDTQQRQDFFRYLAGLLTQIGPNMNDLDKFFVCWRYLDNWTAYNKSIPTGVPSEHTGVCIDYASNLALLLNIAGIQAVPNTCGEDALGMSKRNEEAQSHGMTFAYLDIDGTGKKWYGSDPTFSDNWGSTNISSAKAPSAYENTQVMLYALSDNSLIHPSVGSHYQQYFGNQFFGLPWNYIWNQNKIIGDFSIGDFNWDRDNKWLNNQIEAKDRFKISNPIYNNGKWYLFEKGMNELKEHFVSVDGLFDNTFTEINNLPENLVFSDNKYRPLLLNSYNNWALFRAHYGADSDNNIVNSIAFAKMTTTGFDFNNITYVPITNKFRNGYVYEYYITMDGILHVFGSDNVAAADSNVNVKIDLKNDYSTLWNDINYSSTNLPSDDVLTASYNFFSTIAGVYQLGNKDSQATLSDKKKYFEQITHTYENSSLNNWSKLLNFRNYFNEYVAKAKRDSGIPFKGSIINKQYLISKELFKISGIKIELFLYLNPDEIIDNNTNNTYEFYYQEDGSNDFVKICTSHESKITPKDFTKAGFSTNNNGTLKVRYYQGIHSDQAIEATTRIIFTDEIDTTTLPYVGFYHSLYSINQTNYSSTRKGWETNEITIRFNTFGLEEVKPLEPRFTIKRINPSTMNIETIKSNLSADEASRFEVFYGDVSESNHGIYWLEMDYRYNNQSFKAISKFTFIFTYSDVDNFQRNIWIDAINKISQSL